MAEGFSRAESPLRLYSPTAARSEPVPQAKLSAQSEAHYSDKALEAAELEDHRNVYVAVHIPYSMPRRHKHRHKKKHHHKRDSSSASMENERRYSSPVIEPKTPVDPCDRVRFILGTDETDHPDIDHAPHSIFTELEELKYDHHENKMEWKETARWVKFEEEVEEGGDKWSKPHVASLSLHSLFELRSSLMKGAILLDLPATNLSQISDYVLDSLVQTGQLEEENREKVRLALLQRHKHQSAKTKEHDNKFMGQLRSFGDIGRISSAMRSLSNEGDGGSEGGRGESDTEGHRRKLFSGFPFSAPNLLGRRGSVSSRGGNGNGNGNGKETGGGGSLLGVRQGSGSLEGSTSKLGSEGFSGSEDEVGKKAKFDHHFMKKLPPGSEASNVLVGEVDFLRQPVIAFVRLAKGQVLGDLTEVPIPTRFMFILLGPQGNHTRYHEIGRSIATLMSDEVFHDVAYKARNREDLLAGIDEFLDKVTVLPPGEWDPQIRLEPPSKVPCQDERKRVVVKPPEEGKDSEDGEPEKANVQCSKIPFSGLIQDVRRRYPKYASDIWDFVSLQGVAAIIFIFFANITPAITFGGVLGDITEDRMGAVESILAVSIGNMVFALFAGQPLVILGPTGPTLIFEDIIYTYCKENDIPYLNFRFWIGLWTSIIIIFLVAVNASAIMQLFTRFTEEIFSALVSFIFIYEALAAVWGILLDRPYSKWILFPTIRRKCSCYEFASEADYNNTLLSNATNLGSYWDDIDRNCSGELLRRYEGKDCRFDDEDYEDLDMYAPDVFLMSVILFLGTFFLSLYLKKFRNSRFFTATVRRIVSDFAVFIAVVVWVGVDLVANVETPKLTVPNVFDDGLFTDESRSSLFINPFGSGLPAWAPPAAIIPALLATILIFMDQQITALIVNRKDHKLKKGSAYHLDLLIIGILVFVNSALGLPWVVGATVRSITHVQALFKFSDCTAPGERPKFLGVREQRVTLFVMAVLLGLAIMPYQALKLLPMPVLYGIFLYIGVASLYGVQFVQRLVLFAIPNKYKPDYQYLRQIPNRRIHAYTLFQVMFLLLLCVFKLVSQISIVFPIMVLLLVLGRWLVGFFFTRRDLEILDDPISEKLYCKALRKEEPRRSLKEVEEGEEGEDIDSKEPGMDAGGGGGGREGGERNGQLPAKQFNMSQEVDRCDLWRNMIRNLDAPPPSPHKSARYRGKQQVGTLAEIPEIVLEREASETQVHGESEGLIFEVGSPPGLHLQPPDSLYQSTAV